MVELRSESESGGSPNACRMIDGRALPLEASGLIPRIRYSGREALAASPMGVTHRTALLASRLEKFEEPPSRRQFQFPAVAILASATRPACRRCR